MSRACVLLLALHCACANLPSIGVACGNGVLDPGEDCDTPDDPRCQMCGWACGSNADCVSIPAPKRAEDYACGVDGFCHAPGGALAAESGAPAIQASRFYVTDVNGDGYGDVVGIAPASLDTRYGDAAGDLAESALTVTAGAAGDVAIVDIDGDGRLDTIAPTRDGIVAYASPFAELLPYAFTLEVTGVTITPLALVPLDALRTVALYVELGIDAPSPPRIQGVVVDFSVTPPQFTTFALCDIYAPNAYDGALDFYPTSDGSNASVGFTFVATNAGGVRQLCGTTLLETPGSGSGSAASPTYTVGTSYISAPPTRTVLAELDETTCPSLLVAQSGTMVRYVGSRQNDLCTYTGATAAMPTIGLSNDTFIGHIPLVPRIAGLTPDAVVTTGGVYGIPEVGGVADPNGTPVALYIADRPLTEAASGDLDGNGTVDGVALGDDSTIDVLYRTVAPDGFVRGRLATDSTPSHVVVADFDGNGVDDVSYVVAEPRGDALEIVYGTPAGPLPAIDVADFGSVIATVRQALPDSANPNSTISGLAVAESRNAAAGSISLASRFDGSVDRALVPFFDPRGTNSQSTYRAIVGGHFACSSSGVDVLAVEVPDGSDGAKLWQFQGGTPGSILYPVQPIFTPPTGAAPLTMGDFAVVDCAQHGDAGFCVDGSKLVDWPESGNSDHVIAIDATNGTVFDLDPSRVLFALPNSPGVTCEGSSTGSAAVGVLPSRATPPVRVSAERRDDDRGVRRRSERRRHQRARARVHDRCERRRTGM